jgi:predicted transcriptional regulator of viral defense system
MPPSAESETLELIRRLGVVRPRDLEDHGIPRSRLYRLVAKGLVERSGRGLYVASEHAQTEAHALVLVAKRVPGAIVCLLSALRFHDLTTQLPREVWIAIPEKARRPSLEYPPPRIVRFSGRAFTEGVETHQIEGVDVKITSVGKTVADCFKYRHKIGLDVALEALRQAWRERRVTIDELGRFARVCRVERVMRPYVESLVA